MMNFLESLTAEWYIHKGYFVRTNVKFAPRQRGGFDGEMDVLAYDPQTLESIHIETSTDADPWPKRAERFKKKFANARRCYKDAFPFLKSDPRQIAIVGFNRNCSIRHGFPEDIEIIHIPEFVNGITNDLKNRDPLRRAISETSPLLRAFQYCAYFSKSKK